MGLVTVLCQDIDQLSLDKAAPSRVLGEVGYRARRLVDLLPVLPLREQAFRYPYFRSSDRILVIYLRADQSTQYWGCVLVMRLECS